MYLIKLSLLALTLVYSVHSAAMAKIPLVNNQPHHENACPFSSNTSPTTVEGRSYNCVKDEVNIVWTLTIPAECESGGCGLILDIHGGGMNANTQDYGTKLRAYGSNAVSYSAPAPYIVAQPSLTNIFDENGLDIESLIDNADDGSVDGRAYINEFPHIKTIMQELVNTFAIDTTRIHINGFSRGGQTVSRVYCNKLDLGVPVASYSIVGAPLACDLKPNFPLIMINGNTDNGIISSYPGSDKMEAQDIVENFMLAQDNVNEITVHEDNNWETQTGFFLSRIGQHIHKHFDNNEGYIFDSIRHSAQSIPAVGHCHPVTTSERWLVCTANFDTGEKMIDFFIKNE